MVSTMLARYVCLLHIGSSSLLPCDGMAHGSSRLPRVAQAAAAPAAPAGAFASPETVDAAK